MAFGRMTDLDLLDFDIDNKHGVPGWRKVLIVYI
jgi:hypothetical protein